MSDAAKAELVAKLRALRRQSGMSEQTLADRSDMSQSKISRIERGKQLPSLDEADRILQALACRPKIADRIKEDLQALLLEHPAPRPQSRVLGKSVSFDEIIEMEFDASEVTNFAFDFSAITQTIANRSRRMELWRLETRRRADQLQEGAVRFARTFSRRRRYRCVLPEEVLIRRTLNLHDWVEQLESLKRQATLGSVELGILPLEVELKCPLRPLMAYNGSVIVDDDPDEFDRAYATRLGVKERMADFETLSVDTVWEGEAMAVVDRHIKRLSEIDLRDRAPAGA